jgi:hypothetical protein
VQIPNEIMPIALVRSISLPNLKVYTTISLLLVSGCLYYAFDVVRTDPQWKLHQNTSYHSSTRPSSLLKSSNDALAVLTNSDLLSSLTSSLTSSETEEKEPQESIFEETTGNVNGSSFTHQLKDVLSFMTHEPVCIWVSRSHLCLISDCFGVADKICFRKRQSQPAFDTVSIGEPFPCSLLLFPNSIFPPIINESRRKCVNVRYNLSRYGSAQRNRLPPDIFVYF